MDNYITYEFSFMGSTYRATLQKNEHRKVGKNRQSLKDVCCQAIRHARNLAGPHSRLELVQLEADIDSSLTPEWTDEIVLEWFKNAGAPFKTLYEGYWPEHGEKNHYSYIKYIEDGKLVTGPAKTPTGQKHDNGKPQYHLLPPKALEAVVKVLTYGAKKYSPEGWRDVPNGQERYFDAAHRHLWAWKGGEELDPESGLPHLAHAAASLLFMVELTNNDFETEIAAE